MYNFYSKNNFKCEALSDFTGSKSFGALLPAVYVIMLTLVYWKA